MSTPTGTRRARSGFAQHEPAPSPPGASPGPIERYLSPAAAQAIRDEIALAGGREVFFIANTDMKGIAVSARAHARGHETAVPALTGLCMPHDVVIHNHPSGVLAPSEADLGVASALGQLSVGCYIVDNAVTRLYAVVEPFQRARAQVKPLTDDALAPFLPGGALTRELADFESRPTQVAMARAVGDAINADGIALIEAGTGTGKSMAYLVPAIAWALRAKERVLVSTNTINLQEQLLHKDIPTLSSVLGVEVKAELVKGRSNYVCLRKVDALAKEPHLIDAEEDRETIRDLIAWSRVTSDGSRADLGFVPSRDAWEAVQTESDTCTGVRCEHYQNCFFNVARRRAAAAHVILVNHHLLCADLSIRRQTGNFNSLSLLPPYRRVVLDEAHNLESVAAEYFGMSASRGGVMRLLGQVHRTPRKPAGVLAHLSAKLARMQQASGALAESIDTTLIPDNHQLRELAQDAFEAVFQLFVARAVAQESNAHAPGTDTAPDGRATGQGQARGQGQGQGPGQGQGWLRETKIRITAAVRESPEVTEALRGLDGLAGALEKHGKSLLLLAEALDALPEPERAPLEEALIQTRAVGGRLQSTAQNLHALVAPLDSGWVAWMEGRSTRAGPVVKLSACPIEVGDQLHESLYKPYPTVVMTSATLAVAQSFDYMEQRLGIDKVDQKRVSRLVLDSPFDYPIQAMLGVPTDMPEPRESAFIERAAAFLERALAVSRGRAFVLTTSFSALGQLHMRLERGLVRAGCSVMKQGDLPRHQLLDRFRREAAPVLFGTDSFWEGVDVRGEALSLVVLTHLPFRVPTEPLVEARVEALEAEGRPAFREYTLPHAALKLKQGFGRLIRSRSDRGAVVILDPRIVTKPYGRTLLASLPPARRAFGPAESVLEELQDLFQAT